jgi:branched-chain amino acid transport system permease protein
MSTVPFRPGTAGRRSPRMVVDWTRPTRMLPTRTARVALAALVALWLLLPQWSSDNQLTILSYAGVAAIGAIGLNLLTGYAGQVSLGHAFSFAVGAYTTRWLGTDHGLPILVWLPAAALVGAAAGALVGPVALRVRGNYLAIVTLGLVFVGQYAFTQWTGLTGGTSGTSITGAIPAFDTPTFTLGGSLYSREQGLFWLIWALAGVAALLARNLARSRPGRALQAVRDRDLAAEALGVSLPRYKIGAFVVASAYAAVAGALYAVLQVAVQPSDFGLELSVQYIAMILIGGIGSIGGAVTGAVLLGSLPPLIQDFTQTHSVPLVPVASLNTMIFGALIILFVLVAPRGLAAWFARTGAWLSSWPFSHSSNRMVNDWMEE